MTRNPPVLDPLETRRHFADFSGSVQTVAAHGDVGQYASLAVNPVSLRPAIAFFDATHHDLKFTQFNGRAWNTVTVDAPGNVGSWASLKFDKTGMPWIAYYDATHRDLKIANRAGSVWHTQAVDSTGSQGVGASLALTRAGQPVIAYQGSTTGQGAGLKLATLGSAGWSVQPVDTIDDATYGAPGASCSLALDGHDRARISYQSENAALRYAAFDGRNWHTETIQMYALGESGDATDLALDSGGHPYISYCYPFTMGEGGGGTFVAKNLGSGWVIKRVDTTGNGQGFDQTYVSSIHFGKDSNPIVAYRTVGADIIDSDENNLVIANGHGDNFTDHEVITDKTVGGYVSMASEPDGRLLVAYYNGVTRDLDLFITTA